MLTERIKRLRQQSLDMEASISGERAKLLTEFYKDHSTSDLSIPETRAMAFRYILENKVLYLNDDELIVGERGPFPKAVPTYPEVNLHSLEDLEMLHHREKVFYRLDDSTRKLYADEIIPFWKERNQRDILMSSMNEDWLKSYQAGIFTEFQEQRMPGHTVLGGQIYQKGMLGFVNEIRQRKLELLHEQHRTIAPDLDLKKGIQELNAMEISANALISYAERYAELLECKAREAQQAEGNIRESQAENFRLLAAICRKVPAHAPQTFHEALQYYWFVHLGVVIESNPWDSFNPGRLDQHLLPFYEHDLKNGILTTDRAKEILQAFWIKFNNHPAPPKVGVTALESNTYTDFSLINLGGLKEDGTDAVNEMTFIILDVIEEMRLLQPSSMVQVSRKNPDQFIHRALKIISTGFGQPSVFNTDAIIQELLRQGKDIIDARRGGASGCIETGAFGTECYILTGYFNLVKILEITLYNGVDPRTGKFIGVHSGNPADFQSFDDLMQAYELQLRHFVDVKIKGNCIIEELFATRLPVPFLSLLIEDCIHKAKDYNAGGARYNTSYIQGVGLGSLTDSLTSIKYHVFDNETITLSELVLALEDNFTSSAELRHQLIYKTPKYGNDNDYADDQALRIFELYFSAVDGRPTWRGGTFRINLLPTTSHVYFGSVTGAMPDGRLAWQPLSEGISPVQGADSKGPTAVLRSAAKIDHLRTGGTLLNQKFTPSFFTAFQSSEKLTALIRGYFKLGGHHIQFNVVEAETLKEAQRYPEKYKDLIVRVAGYSDYFNDLGKDLQDEIIRRTEHSGF